MTKKKKILTPQDFIFGVATDPEFRKIYFSNPDLLEEHFDVSYLDMASIKKIDFVKLQKELEEILSIETLKVGSAWVSEHGKDSHREHNKDDHRNDSHSHDCIDHFTDILRNELLPNAFKDLKKFKKI